MTYPDAITSQEAFELASLEHAQTLSAVDVDGSMEAGAATSSELYIIGNVMIGEAVKQRYGGDRIVRLMLDRMETVTDRLILVEPVPVEQIEVIND